MRSQIAKIALPLFAVMAIASVLATVYWSANLTNTGYIIAHGCKVYLEDKTTENYNVDWGNLVVDSFATQYRWIYNNGTGASIVWNHDAPSYLQLKAYYEQPLGTWNLWSLGTSITFSQGQWLHVKYELTALPDAINHIGLFTFNTHIDVT